jgi:hypothetical protein
MVESASTYILCTRPAKVLFELSQVPAGSFTLSIHEIYEGSEAEALKALEHARKWYIALLIFSKPK